MSFLLDTDTCSAYLKNERRVVAKVMLHFGGLHLSTITAGELWTWGRRANAPAKRFSGVRDLLTACTIHVVDLIVAEKFGELRSQLLDQGIVVGEMDLFNAAVANLQNLTVVTHNTKDYINVPAIRLEDWLSP